MRGGKDTRGLYRIHQFEKVEQVIVLPADEAASLAEHQAILRNSEELLAALGLPYRVVNVCGGDLGQPQVQKFRPRDLDALPGRLLRDAQRLALPRLPRRDVSTSATRTPTARSTSATR